jgi:hypothetical protein
MDTKRRHLLLFNGEILGDLLSSKPRSIKQFSSPKLIGHALRSLKDEPSELGDLNELWDI